MGEFVRLEVQDGVGIIRLDRPPANAIDLQVGLELLDAIREAEASERVGAIVVWGGPQIFAAGADVKAMATWGPEEVRPSVDALGDAADLLERIPKISIAAVNGYALGGGLELALGCDLRYLARGCLRRPAGDPPRRDPGRGRHPAADPAHRPRPDPAARLHGRAGGRGARPSGSGSRSACSRPTTCCRWRSGTPAPSPTGPGGRSPPRSSAIRAALETPGPGGIRRERELFLDLFGTPDQREGMAAFLEKRQPRFGR